MDNKQCFEFGKIGDRVKAILPCDGKNVVQFERGVIVYIGRRALIKFDSHICGHDGNGLGEIGYYWMMNFECVEKEN
jgi:hypothetical protein